jgi:hypothetical protein
MRGNWPVVGLILLVSTCADPRRPEAVAVVRALSHGYWYCQSERTAAPGRHSGIYFEPVPPGIRFRLLSSNPAEAGCLAISPPSMSTAAFSHRGAIQLGMRAGGVNQIIELESPQKAGDRIGFFLFGTPQVCDELSETELKQRLTQRLCAADRLHLGL